MWTSAEGAAEPGTTESVMWSREWTGGRMLAGVVWKGSGRGLDDEARGNP